MQNVLLDSVSPDELSRLVPGLGWTELSAGQCLQTHGQRVERVYFPESGLVVLRSGASHAVDAAIVGREGMIGAAALLGHRVSSHKAVVRVAGSAWVLPTDELMLVLEKSPKLRERLLAFVGEWIVQMEQSISTMSRHSVHQRLAYWLLMAHDRLDEHEFAITHDGLADSLSVRRPSVTNALHVLEGELAIRSERGRIIIRNRDRLRQLAGAAYREPDTTTRLMTGIDIAPQAPAIQPHG